MNDVWNAIAEDLFDCPTTADAVRFGLRLLVAALLGGALGYERQYHHKRAGLRTHPCSGRGLLAYCTYLRSAHTSTARRSGDVLACPAAVRTDILYGSR